MTPRIKKVKTTSTDSNYNIDDLNSEDSTDDESQPRKKIPLWAQGQLIVLILYLCTSCLKSVVVLPYADSCTVH